MIAKTNIRPTANSASNALAVSMQKYATEVCECLRMWRATSAIRDGTMALGPNGIHIHSNVFLGSGRGHIWDYAL
jgi:hypothetical protein